MPNIRVKTSEYSTSVATEMTITLRKPGVGDAMRKSTRATLVLAMHCVMMYSNCAMTKDWVKSS
jgi:hypothetical protein